MLSKLFNKNKSKTKPKEQDTFCINKMEEDGKIYILRFKNNLWKFADSGQYSYQIGIAVPLHTNQNGFPTAEENEQLFTMEDEIEKEFSINKTAVFAGTIVGGGMKEFIYYTGKPEQARDIFEKLRKKIKHHELQGMVRNDPNWDMYATYGPKKKN